MFSEIKADNFFRQYLSKGLSLMLKVYQYEKCSTCVNALKFLDRHKISYEKISIVEQPPSLADLRAMLKFLNGDIKRLFNTSGQVYREMKLGDKLPKMSEEEALTLLSKNGKLVKRPFALTAKKGLVGFKEEEWKSFVG